MKKVLILILACVPGASLACSEQGAFGVKFGTPVPSSASTSQYDGGHVKNAVGFFEGPVPEPMEGFRHGYGANKDRSFVFAMEATREVFGNLKRGSPTWEADYKAELKVVIEELARIKDDWERKYGLNFEKDDDSGRGWTMEGEVFSARVYTFDGLIRVECSHNALFGKAIKAALQSW